MIKDIEGFKKLARNSCWLSDFEKASLTRETPPLPPDYLAEAAFEAVKEEADFYTSLKEKLPDVYDYLARMKEWLDREDKSYANFPGFPDQFDENILNAIFPPVAEKSEEVKKETIDSFEPPSFDESDFLEKEKLPAAEPTLLEMEEEEKPVETAAKEIAPFGLKALPPASKYIKIAPHPDTMFDETMFLLLLAGSLSLNADEKIKIIEAIPKLSQHQIDELIKIFVEEKVKFRELAEKHKDQIQKLQVQHDFEWEKVICLRFMLDSIKEKVDTNAFFDSILKIENYFQRYLFKDAVASIKKMLHSFPGLVFLYEYYFQALKVSAELNLEAIKSILKTFFDEIPAQLYDVLVLFFEFEQIYLDGKQRFLEKIDAYKLTEEYAYVKPYLLSKYHLYYGEADDSLQEASDYISEAIGIVGTSAMETLLFLYHFQIKVWLAQKDFAGIGSLLTTIFKENIPPYYQYIKLLGNCFDITDWNDKEACKYAMERFILSYARENNLKEIEESFSKSLEAITPKSTEVETEAALEKGDQDVVVEEKELDILIEDDKPNVVVDENNLGFLLDDDEPDVLPEESKKNMEHEKLWLTVQELKQVITELGFVNEAEYRVEREVARLTGLKEFDEAQRLIEANMISPQSEMQRYNLLGKLFSVYKKQEKLETLVQDYQNNYIQKPDFKNAYSYFMLLYNMEGKYRYEVREISLLMMRKYYFLPVVHLLFFKVEHYKFTKGTFTKETEKSIALAVSCGLIPGLFGNYTEYYRWKNKKIEGNLFGLIDGLVFNGGFERNIIFSYNTGWKEIALASFLIGLNRSPEKDDIYCCFAIALDKGIPLDQFVSLLFYVKALNVYFGKDGTLLSNKSISIVRLSKRYRCFFMNAFYASLQAVIADPHHTWNCYEALLNSSEIVGKKEIYLSTFYTAIDYECPQIKDEHIKKAKQTVFDYLERKDFPGDFSFLVFLARALIDDKPYWIEVKNILDAEGAAFDILMQAEKLLEKGEISNFFLGEHSHEEFLSLNSRDWYLLYRFPGQTYDEKYGIKLDTLRTLERIYPLSRHRENIKSVSQEKTVKSFIASLNSGRVHCSIPATIENSKTDALRIMEEYNHRSTILLENYNAIREVINTSNKNLIQVILDAMGAIYKEMEPTLQVKLKSDLFFLFRTTRKESYYANKLNDIFSSYRVDGIISNFISKLKEILLPYLSSRQKLDSNIEELLQKMKEKKIETGIQVFQAVKNIHVLENSEMFQSFRKRIRHGWLIAYLKDCFSRHDLYMDSEAGGISPAMQAILNQVAHKKAKKEMETCLSDLAVSFNSIADKLDREILLIKSTNHPKGLLDYDFSEKDLQGFVKDFFKQYDFKKETLEVFIEHCCQLLDQRTLQCFENIKKYLDDSVYDPLNTEIHCIRETICKWEKAFHHIPGERDQILANLDDAASTFKRNIEIYKTWFDFYQSAVRDFTLPEIIDAAEKMVRDINLGKIKEKNIGAKEVNIAKKLESLYFKGSNFPDLLEVFKILFQNVIYHAEPPLKERKEIKIEISAKSQKTNEDEERITVEFASPHHSPVDTGTLMATIKNEELRRQTRLKSHGGGLAIIEETLPRLKGAGGQIADITWNSREKKFKVRFDIILKEKGAPVEHTRDEILHCIPLDELILEAKIPGGINILVVEDQIPKYQAIKDYLQDILAESHVVHTVDVETTCRLLLEPSVKFDMIILDMTLPQDPSFDSYLEPLAGLSILKVMKLNNIHIPTILVTQYSNWSSEAFQNTRVFIENLGKFCSREYENFYKGTIRFSHTESAWRRKLKDIVYSLEQTVQYKEKILDAKLKSFDKKRQELYQNEMMATLGQMASGMAHEFNTPLQAIKFIAQNTIYFIEKNKIDKHEIDENMKRIVEVVDTMAGQVNHIKALAKDDRLKTDWINLNFIIKSAFNLFDRQLKNRTIKTTFELQENLPAIEANRFRLEQVFINLIQNSMDALEQVKGRKKEIIVRTSYELGESPLIYVYFEDTGAGIRNTDKQKIFEPFFTSKAVGKGMGLGLSIVREIFTELGGTIKLRDESSRGVTFVMEIPVSNKKEV